jgi:hypothetical protein
MSTNVVYTYSTELIIPLPEEHAMASNKTINDAHGYTWAPENDAPKSVVNASYRLHAAQRVTVFVDVYTDGTRKPRLQ